MRMEQKTKAIYESPKVEIVELEVERGFATSGNLYNDDSLQRDDVDDWYN